MPPSSNQADSLPHVTICSIEQIEFRKIKNNLIGYTEEYEARTGNHWTVKGRTIHILPAADPDKKWSILRVYPAHETYHDARHAPTGIEADMDHLQLNMSWTAGDIAQSLVRDWAEVSSGEIGQRGILIIADDVPTQAEMNWMKEQRQLYFQRLITKADEEVARGNNTYVSPRHQEAAKALGVLRPWVVINTALKECPNCQAMISAGALGCTSCSSVLKDWYADRYYDATEVRLLDVAVAKDMAETEKRKAAQAGRIAKPTPLVPLAK